MKGERTLAGIACSGVLAVLDDAVAGTLDPPLAAQVRAHVEACDHCARFGARYAALVARLRAQGPPEATPARVRRILASIDDGT